jgi:hypothetical protein
MNQLLLDILVNEQIKHRYGFTIGIHSPARTGKTLTSVMIALSILIRWKMIKGIITNINLFNLDKLEVNKPVIPLENIKMIKEEEYKNYIILTDEFKRIIDSRMSSSFANMFISNLLSDTGKQSQIHLLTDQNASAIDKRVRGNTDLILYPLVNLKTGLCVVKYFDMPNPYYTFFLEEAYSRLHSWKKQFKFEFEPYYDYYDTEQKIDEYYLEFTPKEHGELFIQYLEEKKYINHPDFKIKQATISLWKQEKGIRITSEQKSGLMEWLLYNTDLNITGRTNQNT